MRNFQNTTNAPSTKITTLWQDKGDIDPAADYVIVVLNRRLGPEQPNR